MNSPKKRLFALSSLIAGASMVLAATASPAQAASPAQTGTVDRKETMILDIDGGKVVSPDLWNPFVPGNRRDHGFHQSLM